MLFVERSSLRICLFRATAEADHGLAAVADAIDHDVLFEVYADDHFYVTLGGTHDLGLFGRVQHVAKEDNGAERDGASRGQ